MVVTNNHSILPLRRGVSLLKAVVLPLLVRHRSSMNGAISLSRCKSVLVARRVEMGCRRHEAALSLFHGLKILPRKFLNVKLLVGSHLEGGMQNMMGNLNSFFSVF